MEEFRFNLRDKGLSGLPKTQNHLIPQQNLACLQGRSRGGDGGSSLGHTKKKEHAEEGPPSLLVLPGIPRNGPLSLLSTPQFTLCFLPPMSSQMGSEPPSKQFGLLWSSFSRGGDRLPEWQCRPGLCMQQGHLGLRSSKFRSFIPLPAIPSCHLLVTLTTGTSRRLLFCCLLNVFKVQFFIK